MKLTMHSPRSGRAVRSHAERGNEVAARRFSFFLVLAICFAGCSAPEDDRFGPVEEFSFTERSGRPVALADLKGKVWVAAFFFTRCAGPCTQVTGSMAQLQEAFTGQKDVLLVSFTVDPEHDTPPVLKAYADRFQADPKRWLFLTGDQDKMYALIRKSFMLGVAQNEGTARTPGNEVLHSTKLWLVDRRGEKRAYFDGTDPEQLTRLKAKVAGLLRERG